MSLTGFCFYRGPSMIDGAPIIAILTGIDKGSRNSKTGHLFQTWILREDINPLVAMHNGADSSVCGACVHRGRIENGRNVGRSCYVKIFQAPLNVWKCFHRGIYPTLPYSVCRDLIAGGKLRGGSYGDPATVPLSVWRHLYEVTDLGTAYTHQWRKFPELAEFCMASVDSESERLEAKLLGFRTFRVRRPSDPILAREVACPASKEMNHKTTCDKCVACGGLRAKAKADITIISHGPSAGIFNRLAA